MIMYFRKTAVQACRPYIPGEDLSGISVNDADTPEDGGMIGLEKDGSDGWYISKEFMEDNYVEVLAT